jgi:hypothetical protein
VSNERMTSAARDELFSHINRCGVLTATVEDQSVWMDETIDYIGERYPDLADTDLKDLHAVGMRFCQPAINNIPVAPEPEVAEEPSEDVEVAAEAEGEASAEAEAVPVGVAAAAAEDVAIA